MNLPTRRDAPDSSLLQKFPLPAVLIAGLTGFLVSLAVGGGAYWVLSRPPTNRAPEPSGVANALPASASNVFASPAESRAAESRAAASPQGAVTPVADSRTSSVDSPVPRPNPNRPSVLGIEKTVDRLESPASFPKGMLAFLRGLDLLAAFHPDRKSVV